MSETCSFSRSLQTRLLWVAARAIAAGCDGDQWPPLTIDPGQFPAPLQLPRATFVTIRRRGHLRGCRGSVTATEPLVINVARSARAAAFTDERFPPITVDELSALDIHVSILNAPEPLPVADEAELLAELRPGRDGLILTAGTRQGLFLPAVWNKLPEPRVFVEHLKQKAGFDVDFWSTDIHVQRFTVEECRGDVAALLHDRIVADDPSGDA